MALEYLRAAVAVCPCRCDQAGPLLLLVQLANFAGRDGVAYPSHETLLSRCRRSRIRDLRTDVDRLALAGLLVYLPGGGRSSSRYVLSLPNLTTHSDGSPLASPCPRKAAPTYIQRGLFEHGLDQHGLNEQGLDQHSQPVLDQHSQPVLKQPPDPVFDPGSLSSPPPSSSAAPTRPAPPPQHPVDEEDEEREPDERQETGDGEGQQNSPAVHNLAWRQMLDAAKGKLQGSPKRDEWLAWCQAFDASKATPAMARIVGEWVSGNGLDWLKMPKLAFVLRHWDRAMPQALEWHAGRAPTRAAGAAGLAATEQARGVLRKAREKAVPPSPDVLAQLQAIGLGHGFGEAPSDGGDQ